MKLSYEGTLVPAETSATLSISMGEVGTYSCQVINEAGAGMDNITIDLGLEGKLCAQLSQRVSQIVIVSLA